MAAMKITNNPIFADQDQMGGSSSNRPSPPPLPIHNPPSQSYPPKKQPIIDVDGFQLVSNRKSTTRSDHNLANVRQPNGFSYQSRNQSQSRTNGFQPRQYVPRTFQNARNDARTQTNSNPIGQNQEKASTWADMIKKDGINSDFDLQFISPISINQKKIIVVKEEVSIRTECKWGFSVVAYVVGNRPPYHYFKDFIVRTWSPTGNFEIFTRNNGFFIIRFSNEADCVKTVSGGPYFINSRLIILKKWNKNLNLDRDLLSTMPVWIRLPELNLRLWDKDAFSAIASVVGKPIKLDEPTAKETRLSYARILVEITANADLPDEAFIQMHDGESIVQKIEYEWIPPCCKSCICFGHQAENCTAKSNAVDNSVQKSQVNNETMRVDKNFNADKSLVNEDNAEPLSVNVDSLSKDNESFSVKKQCKTLQKDSSNAGQANLGPHVPSLSTDADTMNIDNGSNNQVINNKQIPFEMPENQLASNLAPQSKKSISQQAIEKAVRLVASSSPPENKKKKKSRLKNLHDIMNSEKFEDAEESKFRSRYITKNKAWDNLKIRSKKAFKKKSRNMNVSDEDSSYSDSL